VQDQLAQEVQDQLALGVQDQLAQEVQDQLTAWRLPFCTTNQRLGGRLLELVVGPHINRTPRTQKSDRGLAPIRYQYGAKIIRNRAKITPEWFQNLPKWGQYDPHQVFVLSGLKTNTWGSQKGTKKDPK
jgi:hypothetical protein